MKGDIVSLDIDLLDYTSIYKTSKPKINLGDALITEEHIYSDPIFKIDIKERKSPYSKPQLYVTVHSKNDAIDALKAGADIIYYDITKNNFNEIKQCAHEYKKRCFAKTPRILDDKSLEKIQKLLIRYTPDGVLIGNPGIKTDLEKHYDYSFNIYNDIDISELSESEKPIISPEINFDELKSLKQKDIIVFIHGDIILMETKEDIKAPELVDEEERHFLVRKQPFTKTTEILNSKQLGIFNEIKRLISIDINQFYIDTQKDVFRIVKEYKEIIAGKKSTLKKGYTLGHFRRGVQ
jgi:collagenase-like PrtC family protease